MTPVICFLTLTGQTRQDHHRHCPSPVHHQDCGHHHQLQGWQSVRAGHTQWADGQARNLLSACHEPGDWLMDLLLLLYHPVDCGACFRFWTRWRIEYCCFSSDLVLLFYPPIPGIFFWLLWLLFFFFSVLLVSLFGQFSLSVWFARFKLNMYSALSLM